MDDEKFFHLIARTFAAVRDLQLRYHPDTYKHSALMADVEREIRNRELAAAVRRENDRIALVGPGGK